MEFIALITTFGAVLDALSVFAPKIITFSAVVAAFLPPQSGGVLKTIRRTIDVMAFNFKYATNKDA